MIDPEEVLAIANKVYRNLNEKDERPYEQIRSNQVKALAYALTEVLNEKLKELEVRTEHLTY